MLKLDGDMVIIARLRSKLNPLISGIIKQCTLAIRKSRHVNEGAGETM